MTGELREVWAVVRMVGSSERGFVCLYPYREQAEEHAREAKAAALRLLKAKGKPLYTLGATPQDPHVRWVSVELNYAAVPYPFAAHLDQFLERQG